MPYEVFLHFRSECIICAFKWMLHWVTCLYDLNQGRKLSDRLWDLKKKTVQKNRFLHFVNVLHSNGTWPLTFYRSKPKGFECKQRTLLCNIVLLPIYRPALWIECKYLTWKTLIYDANLHHIRTVLEPSPNQFDYFFFYLALVSSRGWLAIFFSLHLYSPSRWLTAASSSMSETRTTITAAVASWYAAWTGDWPSPLTSCTLTTRWWILQWQLELCRKMAFCTSPTLPMSITVRAARHTRTLRSRERGEQKAVSFDLVFRSN